VGNKVVLVIGGNFGGLTAALGVKAELGGDVDVTVVSASERFLFNPSLIWLPFGKRSAGDITFPLRPVLDAHGIGFVGQDVVRATAGLADDKGYVPVQDTYQSKAYQREGPDPVTVVGVQNQGPFRAPRPAAPVRACR